MIFLRFFIVYTYISYIFTVLKLTKTLIDMKTVLTSKSGQMVTVEQQFNGKFTIKGVKKQFITRHGAVSRARKMLKVIDAAAKATPEDIAKIAELARKTMPEAKTEPIIEPMFIEKVEIKGSTTNKRTIAKTLGMMLAAPAAASAKAAQSAIELNKVAEAAMAVTHPAEKPRATPEQFFALAEKAKLTKPQRNVYKYLTYGSRIWLINQHHARGGEWMWKHTDSTTPEYAGRIYKAFWNMILNVLKNSKYDADKAPEAFFYEPKTK